jgi:hypothetical protein
MFSLAYSLLNFHFRFGLAWVDRPIVVEHRFTPVIVIILMSVMRSTLEIRHNQSNDG